MTKLPENVQDIFLKPGEFFFGESNARIRTLLGSCIAITLWHPQRRIGGICHYMLSRSAGSPLSLPLLDGRYAEDAIQLFLIHLSQYNSYPYEYVVKIYGGGNMFANLKFTQLDNIGKRNISSARQLLKAQGFTIHHEDLGGQGYRRLVFELWSGNVRVHHAPVTIPLVSEV
jgi:chemotaxis protein CheD